jgi:superfamily I DNA/RNA helicase
MVMTVHQAKGREFDGIILFDASASSFPPNVDRMRVFYVAVTRARRSWDLIAPNGRETSYLRALGDRA